MDEGGRRGRGRREEKKSKEEVGLRELWMLWSEGGKRWAGRTKMEEA